MFKIKVGLKSFQTHSMQKCKHQIGCLISYLKQPQTSFFSGREKQEVFFTKKQEHEPISLPIVKPATTTGSSSQKSAPHLNLSAVGEGVITGGFHAKDQGRFLALHLQNKGGALAKRSTKPATLSVESRTLKSGPAPSNRGISRGESLLRKIPLPTLVKKITTLRSPHIDKKSREQFEWKRQKALISFDLNSAPQISFVLFVLNHSRFPGVEIEIGVESKTYFT